ncbi:MAG: TVP38/TMEM64 family protein [Rhodospirillales bacterium]|nr:TVP38/TMEM64 family protein [Rhodospirillales bacterium]
MQGNDEDGSVTGAARQSLLSRLIPLALLVIAAVLFFALELHRYFTFDALRHNREFLISWVAGHPVLAPAIHMAVYATAIVLLPPTGAFMTVVGGFLFGPAGGTFYSVIGATCGATALFLIARHVLGDRLRRRAGPALRGIQDGFQESELIYMFVLRLIPLFPFWLVNIAPAFLGVRLRTFVIGTFFGIIPGGFVFALFGAGIGSILDSSQDVSLKGVLTPEIVAGLVGLACLALLGVGYKKLKARRSGTVGRPPSTGLR